MSPRLPSRESVGREDAIRRLYGRYAHALRSDDTAALVDCFLDDAQVTLEGVGRFTGREAIAGLFDGMANDRPRHHTSDLWIASLSGNAARCLAHVTLIGRATGEIVAYGHYEDRAELCPDGAWRWAERTITIDWAGPSYRPDRAS